MVNNILRIIGLPFLPSNEVEDTFFVIQNITPDFNLPRLSKSSDHILLIDVNLQHQFRLNLFLNHHELQIMPSLLTNILIRNFIHFILQSLILFKI